MAQPFDRWPLADRGSTHHMAQNGAFWPRAKERGLRAQGGHRKPIRKVKKVKASRVGEASHPGPRTISLDYRIPDPNKKRIIGYYANVSKWSMKAKEFFGNQWAEAHFLAGVETHKEGKAHNLLLKQVDRMGFRTVGRPAVPTNRSEYGNSGGNFVATSRGVASYGCGPLDKAKIFGPPPHKRCWSARFIRAGQRDILVGVVYLPPGEENQDRRADAINELGNLVRSVKGSWLIVGDWNLSPENLAASGFPNFVKGTIVHTGETTCRQGQGTNIDYALVHHEMAEATKVEVVSNVPWGPHKGIKVEIHFEVLNQMTSQWLAAKDPGLKTPGAAYGGWGIGAQEWDGAWDQRGEGWAVRPVTREDATDDELTRAYQGFSSKAEAFAIARGGFDGRD